MSSFSPVVRERDCQHGSVHTTIECLIGGYRVDLTLQTLASRVLVTM